jgi:hypothetical protein
MYCGSQINCWQLKQVYKDRDDKEWKLLGLSNTKDGNVAVAIGHTKKKYMKHVLYDKFINNYIRVE